MAANNAQIVQTPYANLWWKSIQRLIGGTSKFKSTVLSLEREFVRAHLIYNIDEVLGIVPRETSDQLDLITIREDGRY